MRIRLATFNIENLGRRSADDLPLAARLPTLKAQLGGLEADILCLQEVNAQIGRSSKERELLALAQLLDGTAYATFARAVTRQRHKDAPLDIHNLVVLSRWPIRQCRQIWNTLVPASIYRPVAAASMPDESGIFWDRPALYVEVDIARARGLHLINLHLRAPMAAYLPDQKITSTAWKSVAGWAEGFFIAAMKRAGQAFEVRLLVDSIFDVDPQALIAVAGDFNAGPHEMPVRLVQGDPADTGNAALAYRALVPLAARDGASAHTVIHSQRLLTLDHVLVSRPLAVNCRRIAVDNLALLDESEAGWLSARRPGSYHAPVVVEFDLP